MRQIHSKIFATAIALLFGMSPLRAQLTTTGTINGTVADPTGLSVAGAKVSITNTDTGTVSETVTNSSGGFSKVGLPMGHYDVAVTHEGFSTFKEVGIYLDPAAVYSVNVALQVGAVSASVTVSAAATAVQTATPEISSTVSGEEVEALPLNGRNYQGMGSLMPGVVNTSPQAAMGTGGFNTSNALNVNGQGSSGSLYTVDGIWNENTGNMTQTTIMPNPDEVSEVKVLQNNYEAKYSLMGASVVIVQTKSGTGTFHGGAWEFLRNTFLDTRNYFNTTISAEEWNIFGWNLGGPVILPHYNHNRQKTFFYFNQQWAKQKMASVINGATPTAAMRTGLFPTTGPYAKVINDPTAGNTPFPGNQIPANRMNSADLAYLNALAPLPNNQTALFNNYLNSKPTILDQIDEEIKVDHNVTSKLRVTGEYFYEGQNSTLPAASRMGSPFATNWDIFKTDNQLAKAQATYFISPAMTNQASIAMNSYDVTHDFAGLNSVSQISGYSEVFPFTGGYLQDRLPHVTFTGGWSQFGTSANNTIPRATDLENTFTDEWSWMRGKHFIEAGITMLLGTKRQWTTGANTTGDASFNGTFTGSPIADFLLGDSATFAQGSGGIRKYIHYPIYTPYIQDRWSISRRFTLSFGIRFLYMPFPNEQAGFIADFDPKTFNFANVPIVSQSGILTRTSTYNPANGMIINGSNGVPLNLTNDHNYYVAPTGGFAWDVFGNGRTALRGGYGITYNRNGGMGAACSQGCVNYPIVQSTNLINTKFPDPLGGAPAPLTANNVTAQVLNYKIGQIKSFSLSLQQQAGNWFFSLAGAGDTARNLQTSLNINQPGPFGAYDYNPLLNSSAYTSAYFAPFQGLGSIALSEPVGRDNWAALEFGLRHPVGHNLYITVAYTWSHNLDNTGGFQNVYAPGLAYGNSSLNTPHVFTTSLIYTVPWFLKSTGWKRTVLAGWKLSDMTTVHAGSSLTMGLSLANTGLTTRPNVIAPVTYAKAMLQWFSTGSFARAPNGYFGDVGNGTITGPGLIVFNMAAYKDFRIHEGLILQFRSEFFNAMNHTNWNSPNTSLGAGTFGQISSAKDPRTGELALKLRF